MIAQQTHLKISGIFCAIALSACAKTVDVSSTEAAIKADLSQRGKLSIKSVTCPQNIQSEAGQSFECVGELEPDGTFFVEVKQNAKGQATWDVISSWRLLNLVQLETEFAQKLRTPKQPEPKINCGEIYRPTQPGDTFECQWVEKSSIQNPLQPKSQTIVVKVEPQGNITWQVVKVVAIAPSGTPAKTISPSSSTTLDPTASTPSEGNQPQSASSAVLPDASSDSSSNVGIKDGTGWTQLAD